MISNALEETLQHPALVIVDGALERGARTRRHPGRIADDERRAPFRKEVDFDDFDATNKIYARHVGAEPPARATVQVAKLPSGVRVEIDAIAHL